MAEENAPEGQDQSVQQDQIESEERGQPEPRESPLATIGIGASAGGLEALE